MFTLKSMKKFSAIYFAIFALAITVVSCSKDDDDVKINTTPYAYIHSFGIDNIKYPFHDVTVDGKDTIVYKVVSGESFKFVIDQKAKEIYNIDSLSFGTNVEKVKTNFSCKGVPYRYDADEDDFVYYSTSDSVDFTSPVRVRIVSTDDTYTNEYVVKLNVHQVDPGLLSWAEYTAEALSEITPSRLVEKDGTLYLFGNNAAGELVVATSSADASSWSVNGVNAPSGADFSSLQQLDSLFYVAAGGALYLSEYGKEWELIMPSCGIVSLMGVCPESLSGVNPGANLGRDMLVAATDSEILYISNVIYKADGTPIVVSEPLPSGFPIYRAMYVASPLATNPAILRGTIVGCTSSDAASSVESWSRLSTEQEWSRYTTPGSAFSCPAFENVALLSYDNAFYAFGGAVGDIAAFEDFYVSHDNGIVWKPCDDYKVKLPASLAAVAGSPAAFAATVSGGKYMWIATRGRVWRGMINRLNF